MRSVLVTGSSTGIGRATAIHMHSLGWQVFAGVRKTTDGDELAHEAPGIRPVIVDVTDGQSIAAAAKEIEASAPGGLDALVNNAGISVNAPLECLDLDLLRLQLEVNVTGQLAVTQALLPHLRRSEDGRIAFVSSVAARTPALPFFGPYAASKFALEALADSLRLELIPSGIKVSLIEPGSVATAIWAKGYGEFERLMESLTPEHRALYEKQMRRGLRIARALERRGRPPVDVARAIEHALTAERPKTRYLIGMDGRIRYLLENPIPDRIRDRLVGLIMGRPNGAP